MQNRRKTVRVGRNHPSHNYSIHVTSRRKSQGKGIKVPKRKYVIALKRKKIASFKINSTVRKQQVKLYREKRKVRKLDGIKVSKGKQIYKINVSKKKVTEKRIDKYKKINQVIKENIQSNSTVVILKPEKKAKFREQLKKYNNEKKETIVKQGEKRKKKAQSFIKEAGVDAAKDEISSQEGGTELLEAAETVSTVYASGKSFIKTVKETTKSVKKTYDEQRNNNSYLSTDKDSLKNKEKREAIISPKKRVESKSETSEKRISGVRSKQEYVERKNVYRKRKEYNKKNIRQRQNEKVKEKMVRKRLVTYMRNKVSNDPEKKDSLGSVAKDIAKGGIKQLGKKIASAIAKKLLYYLGLALGGIMANLVVMMPVIIIVVLLFNSPLAIFFSPDDGSDNLQDVLTGYYTDFSNKVQKEENKDGYDEIQIKSASGELDAEVSKSNYKDVLCVFAEKYGYDLEIAEVNSKVKKKLKKVFNAMNYYSTQTVTKGEKRNEKKTLVVTITQKTWREMIDVYQFDEESQKEIKELLSLTDDPELGIEIPDDEEFSSYAGTDTCIDGKVYDNPRAPVYKGAYAKIAKKTKRYIRPILRKKGMEPYIDIIVSMVQQESGFGSGDNANWLQVNGYKGPAGMASVKAGITHFQGVIKICKQKKIKDIKVLVQSYNMGQGYINFAKKHGGKDSIPLQVQFQYMQRSDGRYGTAGYSNDVMKRVKGQKPKVKNMPLYHQWDSKWKSVSYGSSTIGKGGCGICSSAMVASYWTGKQITPPKLVKWAYVYHTPAGSSHALYAAVAKKYNLKYRDLGLSKSEMVKELKKGHTVIASMGPGEFTRNSHLIVLRTIENGKIRVNDPNDNATKNHVNKKYTPAAIQSEAKHYWSLYK